MTREPISAITMDSLDAVIDDIFLIEMKTTRASIADEQLAGFFFGATAREFDLAERLPDRYLFAFVVLDETNSKGRSFVVLLTLAQLEARILRRRVQFQVDLKKAFDSPVESSGTWSVPTTAVWTEG